MRASDFEFRHRFWVIVLIFFTAFGCYSWEPVNVVEWLLKVLGISGAMVGVFPATPTAHVIFAIGAFLVLVTAVVRTWGTAHLNDEVVRDGVVRADHLVADGPYRYVRNPLYLGNLLMAAGIGLVASPIGWLVLMAGMLLAVFRLIGREEAFLLEKQGGSYPAYLERVPRLWPSLRPRLPAGGTEPCWGQAWVAEMWMWFLFAGSAAFAITLKGRLLNYIDGGGFVVWVVARMFMKRPVR